MRRALAAMAALALAGAAAFWGLTRPQPLPPDAFAGVIGVPERGAAVFWAAGCASCHSAEGSSGDDRLVLAGGRRFDTPFGTFIAPNISPHPEQGIGGWSLAEFGNAMLRGLSPDGAHYYPAFPYTSYIRADLQDVADLKAFIDTLPESDRPDAPHDLAFPFNIRRGLGLWKRLHLNDTWVLTGDLTAQEERGRTLVEALGHCAECHTPRGPLGGLDTSRWMQGAPNPSGEGRIPDLTAPHFGWSAAQISGYLFSGFTPEFDVAGGSMADVVAGLAELPREDHDAIAAYLLRLRQGD